MFLGAVSNKGDVLNNSSANDYVTPGMWSFNRDFALLTDVPSDVSWGQLFVFKATSSYGGDPITQMVVNHTNALYCRTKWNTSWSSWFRVDNFGCSTPADLASLLGGLKSIDLSSSSLSDFNDLPTTEKLSLMFCTVDSNTLNKPFASLNGGCLVISLNTTMSGVNYSYQAMTDSGNFCIRKKWTTGWTSWIVIPNS